MIEKAFLQGAISFGFLIVSLFFLRFWQKTKDRFFTIFSLSFLLLSVEVFLTALLKPDFETRSVIYSLRLTAFLLIIVAVVDKNRKGSRIRPP